MAVSPIVLDLAREYARLRAGRRTAAASAAELARLFPETSQQQRSAAIRQWQAGEATTTRINAAHAQGQDVSLAELSATATQPGARVSVILLVEYTDARNQQHNSRVILDLAWSDTLGSIEAQVGAFVENAQHHGYDVSSVAWRVIGATRFPPSYEPEGL